MTPDTAYAVDQEMEAVMAKAYADAQGLLQRNRAALDEIIRRLTVPESPEAQGAVPFNGNTLDGDTVRAIVQEYGDKQDLAKRDAERAVFL